MRIVAGKYRGRKLNSFQGVNVRPTSDRVKEALFNILGNDIYNCTFLDLFSGTGNIGIEALSRGASNVVFVDSSAESINIINDNIKSLKIDSGHKIVNSDYLSAVNHFSIECIQFDIIYIDPPYCKDIEYNLLGVISDMNILNKNGLIVIEHKHSDKMPNTVKSFDKIREKKYGNSKLSFYSYL